MSSPVPDRSTPEFRDVTAETFRTEILPAARPAILRGLVGDWPAVRAGLKSPETLADHVRGFDTGAPVRFAAVGALDPEGARVRSYAAFTSA